MSKEKTIVPDITFGSSENDLSIEDIVKQNNQVSTKTNTSTSAPSSIDEIFSDNTSSSNTESRIDEYVQPDRRQVFNPNEIQDLQQNSEDVLDSVKDQMSDYQNESQDDEVDDNFNVDIYSAALELIKDQGILNLPDDVEVVDENVLNQVLAYDQQVRNQNALYQIRSQVQDPRLLELFDHALNGGTYEEAIQLKETVDEQYNFANLDTQNQDHQRFLIENYLLENLNPNHPVDARRLEKLPQEIDSYFESMEAESLANEAQQYFINKLEYIKESYRQEAIQREEERRQFQLFNMQRESQWIDNFKNTLNSRPWSNNKKNKVIEQFNIVSLDTGEETELWKYKWNKIWENPELTHVLMDFLSDLDPYTLQFNNRDKTVDKQVTSKIMQLINNKNKKNNSLSGGYSSNNRTNTNSNKVIDPNAQW
jgi:hypothetical protein